jgi:hypothetical protein
MAFHKKQTLFNENLHHVLVDAFSFMPKDAWSNFLALKQKPCLWKTLVGWLALLIKTLKKPMLKKIRVGQALTD